MSSLQVVSAAVAHSINAYHVPAVSIEGRVCITNTPSNIAFRGYGRPQGMIMIEDMMDRAAHQLDIDPALVWPACHYSIYTCAVLGYIKVFVLLSSTIHVHSLHYCVSCAFVHTM